MIRAVGCALIGGYAAVLGVLLHRQVSSVAGIAVPWGLLVVLGLVWSVAAAAGVVLRTGAGWAAGGWALVVLALQAGGDVLIAADGFGWTFLLAPLVLFAVSAGRSARGESGSTS